MPLTGEIEEQYGEKGEEVVIWRPVCRAGEMDALVERVARAMFEVHHESLGLPASEAAWEVTGRAWRQCARAAINTISPAFQGGA